MNDTKEMILLTALRLFAEAGYEAVSVSQIASKLGMVKSALYKHYKSKQDILDSIVRRMSDMDREKAEENEVPEGTCEEMPEVYEKTTIDQVKGFTMEMFLHWTEEEFSMLFRKMLTIEQYRSVEMRRLYEQYLSTGPLAYVKDLLEQITKDQENAQMLALRFYAPMYMLYSLYDEESDKERVKNLLARHLEQFVEELKETYKLE